MKKTDPTMSNTLKAMTIGTKYETECNHFFDLIDKKHTLKQNDFKLLSDESENDKKARLSLMKVQFLKLCNLEKINEILSLTTASTTITNDVEFKEIANDYVKSATHEILLYSNQQEEEEVTTKQIIMSTSLPIPLLSRVVKYRLDSSNSNATISTMNMTLSTNTSSNRSDETFFSFMSKEKIVDLFWSVVPREDLLLAVIVPLTIICSMCILTVVVACLLHMFNRSYRENKTKLLLLNNKNDNNNIRNKVTGSTSCTSDSTKLGN